MPRTNGEQTDGPPVGEELAAPRRSTEPWKVARQTALLYPTKTEEPFAFLIRAIEALSRKHGDDYVLREGIAHLILGTLELLNAETGRLDCGTIHTQLNRVAQRMSYDL